jgi:hypothetical protein
MMDYRIKENPQINIYTSNYLQPQPKHTNLSNDCI